MINLRRGELLGEIRQGTPDGWIWEIRRDVRTGGGDYLGNELLASGGAPSEASAWKVMDRALARAVRVEESRAKIAENAGAM